jgi:hypothetical protein
MELTGDVRAAILRVLEEYSPTEGDSADVAQASVQTASRGPAAAHSSSAGATGIPHAEQGDLTGRRDRSFPV